MSPAVSTEVLCYGSIPLIMYNLCSIWLPSFVQVVLVRCQSSWKTTAVGCGP